MQNMYANSFQIHSNTADVGLVLFDNYQGLDSPDYRLSTFVKPGEHGAQVSNQLYGGRSIILNGRISSNSIAQYQSLRRQFQAAMRIIKDINRVSQPVLLQFTTMDNLALQANVYLKDALQIQNASLNHGKWMLHFYSPDPNLYTQSQSIFTTTVPTSTGAVYPIIYPITYPASTGGTINATNAGDVDTPVIFVFNGPLTFPYITNLTTGEVFLIDVALGSTDQLIVDTAQKTMVLNGNSNALQYFDLQNTWMQLIPGLNVLKLGSGLSSDTGNVQLQFRSAYFGI